MIIYWRDEVGAVAEQLSDDESGESVDFCGGYAYWTSPEGTERKIPLDALIKIER